MGTEVNLRPWINADGTCRHCAIHGKRCHNCTLAETDGRYQRLWNLPVTAPDGPFPAKPSKPQSRVAYCGSLGRYRWYVTQSGRTLKEGDEATEPEAEEAADAFLATLPVDQSRRILRIVNDDKSPGGGIGDNLMLAAVAHSMGAQVACRDDRRPWVELFADVAEVHEFRLNEYQGRHLSPRWEWWGKTMGTQPTLPPLKPLPADAVEWAIPFAGEVVIAPFAHFGERSWPVERWIEVERILESHGHKVVILDDTRGRTDGFRSMKLIGESPARVAAVIRSAVCFAGNDSGMAHVAGMSRVPGVVLASRASDVRIMGMYGTIKELGGRHAGYEHIGPSDVTGAIFGQIQKSLGDFPMDDFAAVLAERDRWRTEGWLPIYAALWRTIKEINPKRVVEIGSRAGYSAWTFLKACPGATVAGFDLDCAEHGGYVGAHEHARKINDGSRFTLTIQDSHTIDRLPECDMAYVDGDHLEQGAYDDLCLCERSGVPVVMIDDISNLGEVKRAADRFCRERNIVPKFIPSLTGLYLIGLRG